MADAPVRLSSRLRALKEEWNAGELEWRGTVTDAFAQCAKALDLLIPASEALEQQVEKLSVFARQASDPLPEIEALRQALGENITLTARCAALEREIADLKTEQKAKA